MKAKLSQYLDSVKAGEEILVTERGRPVARLTPVRGEAEREGRMKRLTREGRVRPPRTSEKLELERMPRPRDPEGTEPRRADRRETNGSVRFWDSSALVPLCVIQQETERAEALLRGDHALVIWWGSPVECASAFARIRREGALSVDQEREALSVLSAVEARWTEVLPGSAVRETALRLLRTHPLKPADALQLSAALEWAGTPSGNALVTFDERLREAALLEGFDVP